MATVQEIDAQIAALQGQIDAWTGDRPPTALSKQMEALNAQRFNLTASDATLNAQIAALQRQIDAWTGNRPPVGIQNELTRLIAEQNRRAATATLANPSATPAQIWDASQIVTPVTIGATEPRTRLNKDDLNPQLINQADAQTLALANAHAAQNTPQWQAAVNAYNTGQPVSDAFVPLLNQLNTYYQQGQAAPGNLAPTTAGEALRQWGIDAQPGGFDKFMNIAAPLAFGALTGGVGGLGAIGGGAIAGATSAGLQGGNLADIVKGGVTGGALGYGGGMLADYTGLGSAGSATTSGMSTTELAAADPYLASIGGASGVTPAMETAGMLNAAGAPGVAAGSAASNVATGLGYDMLGTAATGGGMLSAASAASPEITQATQTLAQSGITPEQIAANANNPTWIDSVSKTTGLSVPTLSQIGSVGTTMLASYLQQQDAQALQQQNIAAQQQMLTQNQQYATAQTQAQRDYLAKIAAQQTAAFQQQQGQTQAAISGLTPLQQALYSAQAGQAQQQALTDAQLANIAATQQAGAAGAYGAGLGTAAGQYGIGMLTAAQQYAAGLGTAGQQYANVLGTAGTQLGTDITNATQQAAALQKFTPVGVTTRFGTSTPTGYNLSPEALAQQNALMGVAGQALGQYQGATAATAPMGTAAQTMFGLGQGYLQTSPQAQAAQYMAEQQALLAPTRERELAQLQAQMQAQGRGGLAIGGTSTGMGAANPQLEAFLNAQRMQDLQLAAQATQGGQQYAQFGAGMIGQGAQTLQGMYGTQQAAYQPYATALGGAQTLESMGQNALTIGTGLGQFQAQYGATAGNTLMQGLSQAAQARYAGATGAAQVPFQTAQAGLGAQYQAAGTGLGAGLTAAQQGLQTQYQAALNPAQYANYLAAQQTGIGGAYQAQLGVGAAQAPLQTQGMLAQQLANVTSPFATQAAQIPTAGQSMAPFGQAYNYGYTGNPLASGIGMLGQSMWGA